MGDPVKPGVETSEYAMAASSNWLSVVLTILGVIVSIGSALLPGLGENTKVGIIVGAVVAIAGVVSKALVSMGYSASRSEVKAAQLNNEKL